MIAIDPNQRTTGNHGWTFVEPGELDGYEIGDAIVVHEPECGIAWPATIVDMWANGFVELDVSWRKGKPFPT